MPVYSCKNSVDQSTVCKSPSIPGHLIHCRCPGSMMGTDSEEKEHSNVTCVTCPPLYSQSIEYTLPSSRTRAVWLCLCQFQTLAKQRQSNRSHGNGYFLGRLHVWAEHGGLPGCLLICFLVGLVVRRVCSLCANSSKWAVNVFVLFCKKCILYLNRSFP